MKRLVCSFVIATVALSTSLWAQLPAPAPSNVDPAKLKGPFSYSIGLSIGKSMERDGLLDTDIDSTQLLQGLSDGLSGAKPRLTEEQMKAAMQSFQVVMQQRLKAPGEQFLAANAKKPGVMTLPSGLQYKILKRGTGATPKATDTVRTHYQGTLIDGKVFDSSIKRGMPATFPVNGVIRGWTEALQKMKVGDKWQLFIPENLAYGARGGPPGSGIGPYNALVFEIELLGIE